MFKIIFLQLQRRNVDWFAWKGIKAFKGKGLSRNIFQIAEAKIFAPIVPKNAVSVLVSYRAAIVKKGDAFDKFCFQIQRFKSINSKLRYENNSFLFAHTFINSLDNGIKRVFASMYYGQRYAQFQIRITCKQSPNNFPFYGEATI